MVETDIAKIVSLIMENPSLVEQIKELAVQDRGETESTTPDVPTSIKEKASETETLHSTGNQDIKRRNELIAALKPYVSDERRRALDTFMAIADVLNMMRAK